MLTGFLCLIYVPLHSCLLGRRRRLSKMVKDKLKKHVLTAFTPNEDSVAILSANEVAKVN